MIDKEPEGSKNLIWIAICFFFDMGRVSKIPYQGKLARNTVKLVRLYQPNIYLWIHGVTWRIIMFREWCQLLYDVVFVRAIWSHG